MACRFTTKIIIEMKSLQNNDLIRKMILSKTGRDKNHLYVIIGHLSDNYITLNNGSTKTAQMPREKNLKHINALEDVGDKIKTSIISKDRGTDLKIKRFLKPKGITKEGWLPYVER